MSVPSWARKGALVVCVYTGPLTGHLNLGGLVKGGVYTVRDVVRHQHIGTHGVRLVEISRPLLARDDYEQPFGFDRFRPLVDDANDAETEREIYRKKVHQNAAPRKVSERA
jgi:hypothetical protein